MSTYRIIRFHKNSTRRPVFFRGLTLEQAQAHCRDPETRGATATSAMAARYTKRHGAWFDAYEEERG